MGLEEWRTGSGHSWDRDDDRMRLRVPDTGELHHLERFKVTGGGAGGHLRGQNESQAQELYFILNQKPQARAMRLGGADAVVFLDH